MRRRDRPAILNYLIAVVATAGAVLVRAAIDPLLGERTFTPILYVAVAISIWFGGWGPAALSAVLGYVAVHALFVHPTGSLFPTTGEWVSAVIYLTSCAILIAFGEAVSISERRLQTKQRELELESTERRVVDDELRASRQREQERRLELEALMGSAPVSIWVAHDPECRTITGNPAASAMLGVPAGTNLSRSVPAAESVTAFEIYRGGSLVETADLPIQTAVRTASAVSNQELEYRFLDGRPSVWVYGNVEPLLDHRGSIRGAIGTFVDITERRRAEELQRETEGRFRTLADQAPVLIWLNSMDGCEYVNREYLRFVGADLEAVRGMGWTRWVHPDDFEEYAGAYRRALDKREAFDAQFRFRSASGEYRWLKSAGLPRLTADGSLVGFVGCSFDITDVKEAIDALQESDRRKDEFLATLAHELRNPLAPLRNGLGILRLSLDGDRGVEHTLAVMERQLAHLVRLIDDLVDVSRISRGKIELRRQPMDLAAAVAEAAAIARPRIEAEGRELAVELPSEPLMVDGDGTRLAQVVANLLDNAAKYTDRGGHIRLAVERREGDAAISVEDDGIGIPPEMLDRIFEMFTQVDRPLERQQQGGLGIGLTLVRRLMELHGGSVEASSAGAGRGCRFVVRLPLAAAGAAVTSGAQSAREPEPRPAARRRVLVVDDNSDAADSQSAMLRLMGHEVESASDGFVALETAAVFRPDLVLLDIGMPKLNGYEVCRRLRAEPWGAGLLIVAVTGWGQDSDKQRAREAGFDHHLTKPMDPTALYDLLKSMSAPGVAASPGPIAPAAEGM
ncbi:MAG TPA: ATP-binding protein [Thermoanaerobaculia bacterium]|nr:ATP-binding protein [Thermoanaerobaculia bacterium]